MDKERIYDILNEAYFSENPHEKAILDQLQPALQGAKTFVDVGASLGQYTAFANQHLQGGKIVAIEADPVRVEKLKENAQTWMAHSTNQIEVIYAAVCERIGTTTFHTSHSNTSGGIAKPEVEAANTQWEAITVPAVTLDSLFNSPPDFIKVDIEGGELDLLKGATQLLQTHHPQFFIELHHWANPPAVLDFMRSYSYYPRYIATGFHCLFAYRQLSPLQAMWYGLKARLKKWL